MTNTLIYLGWVPALAIVQIIPAPATKRCQDSAQRALTENDRPKRGQP